MGNNLTLERQERLAKVELWLGVWRLIPVADGKFGHFEQTKEEGEYGRPGHRGTGP